MVCIDYDGVLVDSFHRILAIIADAQSQLGAGRAPTAEDLRTIEVLSFPSLAERLHIPRPLIADFAEIAFSLQQSYPSLPEVFAGIPEMLRDISRTRPIVIITASHREEVLRTLAGAGAETYISRIMDGRDIRSKSERIRFAIQHYDAAAGETFMIGDARSDIREGKLAHAKTIAVSWGFQPKELLALEQPDWIVDLPQQILEVLNPA